MDNKKSANTVLEDKISIERRYLVDPVISCRIEKGEGAILFNPDNDSTILINEQGLLIWEYLAAPRTVDDISIYISANTGQSPDKSQVISDVTDFLSDLYPGFINEAGNVE